MEVEDFQAKTQKLENANIDPVLYAINKDRKGYLSWLLEREYSVPNEAVETVVTTGNIPLLELLVPYIPTDNAELLSNAIFSGEREVVRLLLESGFRVNDVDIYSAIDNADLGMLKLLISKIKEPDPNIYMYAERSKNKKIIDYLMELGYGPNPTKDECPMEDGEVIDPILGDPIPEKYLITFKENGKIYCFDVRTLYKAWDASGKFLNPYTRTELSRRVQNAIQKYGEESKTKFVVHIPKFNRDFTSQIGRDQTLGDLLWIFVSNVPIDRYRDIEGFKKFNLLLHLNAGQRSIYEFDLETVLNVLNWTDYVLTLQDIGNLPNYKIFIGNMYPKIYAWASGKRFEWAESLVPDIYKVPPEPEDEPLSENRALMRDIIKHYNKTPEKLFSKMVEYVDGDEPKITADDARYLASLLEESPYKERLEHLIYSRVVDKYNLGNKGIEAYYQMNKYELPNYTPKIST